ncbi:MAG: DNA polymerase III subunit chi [Hyphomicrobiales bacterium]|jgi:DNA polymerase III subunit chi|nr:DNA polymerase III subunit chi [Hyphomicrobiales bacterium]
MMDLMFYQLLNQKLERALPLLLEKARERGWKAVVEVGNPERQAALDDALWTYSDRSFLPHGIDGDAAAPHQPILITTTRENRNGAEIRFLVDGARLGDDLLGYSRIALIFDGQDPVALDAARADWKTAKTSGLAATFWQQSPDGKWEKKA